MNEEKITPVTGDIPLSAAQQKRIQVYRSQIEPLREKLALLEQGVNFMLSTVVEMAGAAEGVSYSLNDEGTVLVLSGGAIVPPVKEQE